MRIYKGEFQKVSENWLGAPSIASLAQATLALATPSAEERLLLTKIGNLITEKGWGEALTHTRILPPHYSLGTPGK